MEIRTDKFAAMVGFAKRSGKIVFGFDCLRKARGVKLLAVSDTASDNLKRNMERLADKSHIPLVYARSLEITAGNNVKALGLTDPSMAKAVVASIGADTPQYTIKNGTRR